MDDGAISGGNADLFVRSRNIGKEKRHTEGSGDQKEEDAVDLPDLFEMKDQEVEGSDADADTGKDDTGEDTDDESRLDQMTEQKTVLSVPV